MTHIVDPCIAAGLVHAGVDGSKVRANASIHSMKEVELAPVQTIEDYLTDLEQNGGPSPGTSSKKVMTRMMTMVIEITKGKNRAKQIRLDGRYQSIQNERVQCEHDFAEAKT